jgi:hypothetical protein
MATGAALASTWAATAQAAAPRVIYYDQGNGLAGEDPFSLRVLQLALAKSGVAYELRPSPLGNITEVRARAAMKAGDPIDVAVLGTSADVDAELRPVCIPIDRGLLGYRVFLIDRHRQDQFARIRTVADLGKLSALQGRGWPDTKIMRAGGLTVWTAAQRNLFSMMAAGRADYFPRGAAEAEGDLVQHPEASNLVLERTLMLRYRFTSLFYVAQKATRLHDDLYRGFLNAHRDGSYMRLFRADPGMQAAVGILRGGGRRVLDIENPYLSPAVAAIPDQFWFDL